MLFACIFSQHYCIHMDIGNSTNYSRISCAAIFLHSLCGLSNVICLITQPTRLCRPCTSYTKQKKNVDRTEILSKLEVKLVLR